MLKGFRECYEGVSGGIWRDMVDSLQPVDHSVVGEAENELVDDSISADGSADKLELCVLRIVEDEMVCIEGRESFPPNSTGYLETGMHQNERRE